MEKVISECRIVETDEGFRVEIKGDKEAMREWLKNARHCGPMGMKHFMRMGGPWGMHRHGFGGCCEGEPEEGKAE